ncbi:MAG: bifunctional diaminohydroxyphosphoribosylaminopyrimidine deaminase/5-amino-6-(5-phosphoribosylamino)uracil reductase RibD [Desulfobacteraceae bacterium]|jgi:diaminohydroxyphosphoribosylaminopyrimidine deaminase/5-amino-6-(5-phosphoribosylamino)uracil reductase|nr:bifunctional diaminohydroxyphosphoribosylaminopyrimidine deaminase/5-amino-6-(5-phosphoribosylamino)uracil reductase RibD [Desulfobacteraceae bacterium]
MDSDRRFMQMALDLAARGAGHTSPNPMVGSVVVKDGRVVGKGYHQRAGGPHAEVLALEEAGDQAAGATLYVTLEPCNHHGRTPPCTERIFAAGIRRVVSAMADPNPGVAGGGHARLRDAGLTVDEGLLADAAARLNETWIKYIRTGLPFVVLKCAATLDGRIATRTGDARWVTGPTARERVHQLRSRMDAILVGVGTVIADDPQLTARLPDGSGRDPLRIILDARLETPPEARMLGLDSSAETLIVCAKDADPAHRQRLEAAGARLLAAPLAHGRIDLKALMPRLGAMQLTSLLLEGGARVAASALAQKVVDKVMFFYAPKILGGEGVPICQGPGPERMVDALAVHDLRLERIGDDVLFTGYL